MSRAALYDRLQVTGQPLEVAGAPKDFSSLKTSVSTPTTLTLTRDGFLMLYADSAGTVGAAPQFSLPLHERDKATLPWPVTLPCCSTLLLRMCALYVTPPHGVVSPAVQRFAPVTRNILF